MTRIAGFPVLEEMNLFRENLWDKIHNNSPKKLPMPDRIGCWFLHKALSVILLPANCVATGVGLVGMAATTCTLGAYKVAVYAATLGNTKLTFPIGFVWLGKRTIITVLQVLMNSLELCVDAKDICYQGYRGLKYVLTACKIDHLLKYVNQALTFVAKRLTKGIDLSIRDEPISQSVTLFKGLQQATTSRSSFHSNQNFRMFLEHKALSLVNIPIQSTVAIASCAIATAALAASTAKAVLYAVTNIHVSMPTGVFYMGRISLISGLNVASNIAELATDGAVALYKIADTLHVMKALASVRDVIAFIPKAVFT